MITRFLLIEDEEWETLLRTEGDNDPQVALQDFSIPKFDLLLETRKYANYKFRVYERSIELEGEDDVELPDVAHPTKDLFEQYWNVAEVII